MTKFLASTALSFMLLGGVAFAQTDITGSGDATSNSGVSIDGSGLDAGANVGVTGGADVNVESDDDSTTASIGADASADATATANFRESLGDSADEFFASDDNDELRSEEEITQALAGLEDEQRAMLEEDCDGVDAESGHSASIQGFCEIVVKSNM